VTVDQLGTIDDILGVGDLAVPDGVFQTTRVVKNRKIDDLRGSPSDIFTGKPTSSTVTRTYAPFPSAYNSHPQESSHASHMYDSYPEHVRPGDSYRPTSSHYARSPPPQPHSGSQFPLPTSRLPHHPEFDSDDQPAQTPYDYAHRDSYARRHSLSPSENMPRRSTSLNEGYSTQPGPSAHHPYGGSAFQRPMYRTHSSKSGESPTTDYPYPSPTLSFIERQSNVRAEPPRRIQSPEAASPVNDPEGLNYYAYHSRLPPHDPHSSSSPPDLVGHSPHAYVQEGTREDDGHGGNSGPYRSVGLAPLHHLQRVQPYKRDPLDDRALRMLGP
jgi:hypothetical protein